MALLPPEVNCWLEQHHGVIPLAELRRHGVDDQRVQRLVAGGVLVRVGRAVYRLAGAPETLESRIATIAATHAAGYATGIAAARLLGARGMPADHRVTWCSPMGRRVDLPPGAILRQSTSIVPGLDHYERRDGIRIATASRLAFDLAADLDDGRLEDFIEFALHRRWVTDTKLAAIARRLCARGRDGSTRFARVLNARLPGGALESGGEVRLAQALRHRGLPLVAQFGSLDVPGGPGVRVDLAVPELRWGIELDLHPSHHRLLGSAADKRRDRRLQLIDWQVTRVTPIDLADFDALVAELVELFIARRRALATRQIQGGEVA